MKAYPLNARENLKQLIIQDIEEYPDTYKLWFVARPEKAASQIVAGLDERGACEMLKSLKSERRMVAKHMKGK